MKKNLLVSVCAVIAALLAAPTARPDVVTDWNTAFEASLQNPAERGPRVPLRTWAIMHTAMFDAVNGIDRKYEPCHVTELAPPGARAEAAAIQAAHTVLSALRPAFQSAYDAQLAVSLASLPGDQGKSQSIARGRAWGEYVAQKIIAWRANDGSTAVLPPYVGSTAPGFWRHAPNGAAPNAGLVNLVTVPFLLTDPSAFDPGPPYGFADRAAALASAAYAADVNEVKTRGGTVSTERTPDDTETALFLHACDVADLNRLMRSILSSHGRLVDNARIFALLNMTAFDTTVVFFRVKYEHALWRPFQSIHYADGDGNAATEQDPTWTSLLPTPPHPEYPSAHVTLFSALVRVMARLEGDSHEVRLSTPSFPDERVYPNLAAIGTATIQARIDVGYHFREGCEVGQLIGNAIGDHVVDHALTPLRP